MDNTTPPPSDLSYDDLVAEFRDLSKNVIAMLKLAWESEERKSIQKEIEAGLLELGDTLEKSVEQFKQSPTGQRLKAEADDLLDRVRRGEVSAKIKEDLLILLRKVNAELEKTTAEETTPAEQAAPQGDG